MGMIYYLYLDLEHKQVEQMAYLDDLLNSVKG